MKPFYRNQAASSDAKVVVILNVLSILVMVANELVGFGDFTPDAEVLLAANALLNLAVRFVKKRGIELPW